MPCMSIAKRAILRRGIVEPPAGLELKNGNVWMTQTHNAQTQTHKFVFVWCLTV